MSHQWDEFSKSLAESVPRRESLRRLGVVFAGAVLSPLGLDTAWARGADPCKTFCNRCPTSRRTNCLTACRACNNEPGRLCGTCGSYVCCGNGRTCCGGACTDVTDDVLNCGACGFVCDEPGPYEFGACIDGECTYVCADGAVDCNGTCTFLASDPYNCGACGFVCGPPGSNEFGACIDGRCESSCIDGAVDCGGTCTFLASDPYNCGACGFVCDPPGPNEFGACIQGRCEYSCADGAVDCGGTCTFLASDPDNCGACGNVCGESTPYCSFGQCVAGDEPCPGGQTRCNGVCTNIYFDPSNCGGCGIRCDGQNGTICIGGVCQWPF
jgi:hypothetical protein